MAKEVKTYILYQNFPMTKGRCITYRAKIRVGASTLNEAIAICQRTFGKTTGYQFGAIDHTMTTPKGIAAMMYNKFNPIVEINGRTWIRTQNSNEKHQYQYVATTSTGKKPITMWL